MDDRCDGDGTDVLFALHCNGILITFGSYMKKETSIEGSTKQVEVFDTAIAMLAGLMIIPAVFAFSGGDAKTLQAGPALMFITIPKVFCKYGIRNICRRYVFRAGSFLRHLPVHRIDGKCSVYV